jgi:hypothetical protein
MSTEIIVDSAEGDKDAQRRAHARKDPAKLAWSEVLLQHLNVRPSAILVG